MVINGISSTPSNTWTSTDGTVNSTNAGHICFAFNANTAATLTANITRSGKNTRDGTLMPYDFTGAAASRFDKYSGPLPGDQTSAVSSLTTCANCLTPSTPSGMVVTNFCTGLLHSYCC